MFDTDAEIKAYALQLWANHIETGKVGLSGEDAAAQNQSRSPKDQIKINVLGNDQKALVLRIRGLARQEQSANLAGAPTSTHSIPRLPRPPRTFRS